MQRIYRIFIHIYSLLCELRRQNERPLDSLVRNRRGDDVIKIVLLRLPRMWITEVQDAVAYDF